MTFNPNIPQATDIISQSQAQLLTNFSQTNTLFSVDHVALTDNTNGGKHKQVTVQTFGTTPFAVTGSQSYIYSKKVGAAPTTLSFLEYQATVANTNLLPITPKAMVRISISNNTPLAGYQFNIASLNYNGGAGTTTITFSEALANTNYAVMLTCETSNSANVGVNTKNMVSLILNTPALTATFVLNVMVF